MAVITDLKVVDPRTGRTEVWLDGARWLEVAADIVVEKGLRRGALLDEAAQDDVRRGDARLTARQLLARHTALGLKTERQARAYLSGKGIEEDAVEAAMACGRERGWLDDRRFAEAYARQCRKLRPMGPRKMIADLAGKGVDPGLAEEVVGHEGPDRETQREWARRFAERRATRLRRGDNPAKARTKLMGALVRQGYDADIAREAAEAALDGEVAFMDEEASE